MKMDRKFYTSVVLPKPLMEKVNEKVRREKLWLSEAEFVRDAVKAKLNIYNFRFRKKCDNATL